MCFNYKATVNYNFSRNGGRHVRIHVMERSQIDIHYLLAKSMICNVCKFSDILPSGYRDMAQNRKE